MEAAYPEPRSVLSADRASGLLEQRLHTEEWALRRRLILISTLFATPMLLFFAIIESQMNHTDMVIFTAIGAAISLLMLHVARKNLLTPMQVRLGIGYMFLMVIYYIHKDFVASSLLFVLVLPFASAFTLGYRESAGWNVVLGSSVMLMILYAEPLELTTVANLGVDFLATFALICIVACSYERSRHLALLKSLREKQALESEIETKNRMAEKNETLFRDLQHALREVRELTGLIPICASCKKVRSDEDYWEHVEGYLHRRTQLTFSHSICPCCVEKAMEALDNEDPGARAG